MHRVNKIFSRAGVIAMLFVLFCGSQGVLYAAQYDLKKITPAVREALEGRKERYSKLQELKDENVIGENNQGYVNLRNNGGQAKKLVREENEDRKIIYTAIAEQNDLKGQLDVIEAVFAEVQREKASPGHSIQNESGEWVEK